MSFTVTAAQGGSTNTKMAVVVKVVTGAAASQPGTTGSAGALTVSIDPMATGSQIYGAVTGTGGGATLTAEAVNSPFLQNVSSTNRYAQFHLASLTTASTPVVAGSSAGAAVGIAAAEILASGSLAENSSAPAVSGVVNATSFTTAAFTPPAPSLLVVMVSALGGAAVCTMALSDTSGLGLNWTEQAKYNASGAGYNGVWTAQVPAAKAKGGAGASIAALSAADLI